MKYLQQILVFSKHMILKANRLQLLMVIPNISTISNARSQLPPSIQEAPMAASQLQLHSLVPPSWDQLRNNFRQPLEWQQAATNADHAASKPKSNPTWAFLSSQSGSITRNPAIYTPQASRRSPSLPLALYFFGSASLQAFWRLSLIPGSKGTNKRGPWKDQRSQEPKHSTHPCRSYLHRCDCQRFRLLRGASVGNSLQTRETQCTHRSTMDNKIRCLANSLTTENEGKHLSSRGYPTEVARYCGLPAQRRLANIRSKRFRSRLLVEPTGWPKGHWERSASEW